MASLTHAVQIPSYLLLRVYLLLAPVASLSPIGEPDDSTYAAALLTRTEPYDYCIIRIGRNFTLKGKKKAEGSPLFRRLYDGRNPSRKGSAVAHHDLQAILHNPSFFCSQTLTDNFLMQDIHVTIVG